MEGPGTTPVERAAVVQGDRSILVEVAHPGYERARSTLARFAEIEKTPEHVHTYRLSDLSLWNAASAGLSADDVIAGLRGVSRFDVPTHLEHEIRTTMGRYGICELRDHPDDPARLRLHVGDLFVLQQLLAKGVPGRLDNTGGDGALEIATSARGAVKQALLRLGYPVVDRAGMLPGEPLPVRLAEDVFQPYEYQRAAAEAFIDAGSHGVVVLRRRGAAVRGGADVQQARAPGGACPGT